jgi:redox-sensing transcriptional repressor
MTEETRGMPSNTAKIPGATIQRLPVYLYRLQAMQANGIKSVCSRELAEELKILPSRLRRDFHYFGSFSRPGHPYEVDHLIARLKDILDLVQPVDFIIAGMGHLGQAIAAYTQFEDDGFRLAGLFDINPKILGLNFRNVPIQDLDKLPELVTKKKIPLGIITVPADAAQSVADLMADAGIRGIWNFAPVNLKLPAHVILHDEFLSVGIMSLSYKMKRLLDQNGTSPDAD